MQAVLRQVDFDTSKLEQQLVVKGSTFEAIKSSSDGVGRHQHKETGNGTGEPAQKYATKPAEKYFVVTTSAKTRPPVSYYVNADWYNVNVNVKYFREQPIIRRES